MNRIPFGLAALLLAASLAAGCRTDSEFDFQESFIQFSFQGAALEADTLALPDGLLSRVQVVAQSDLQSRPAFFLRFQDQPERRLLGGDELAFLEEAIGRGLRQTSELRLDLGADSIAPGQVFECRVQIASSQGDRVARKWFVVR